MQTLQAKTQDDSISQDPYVEMQSQISDFYKKLSRRLMKNDYEPLDLPWFINVTTTLIATSYVYYDVRLDLNPYVIGRIDVQASLNNSDASLNITVMDSNNNTIYTIDGKESMLGNEKTLDSIISVLNDELEGFYDNGFVDTVVNFISRFRGHRAKHANA